MLRTTEKDKLRAMSPARRKAHRALQSALNTADRLQERAEQVQEHRDKARRHTIQMRYNGDRARAMRIFNNAAEKAGEDWSDGLGTPYAAFDRMIEEVKR